MASLPDFPKFDVSTEVESLGIRWKKWTERLENLFVALGIDDKKRQRALLLYYGGEAVHRIYNTVTNDLTEDYAVAKGKLDTYFEPKINLTFEVYNFRQIRQLENEPIDKFVTRLKESASRCNFHNSDREIKDQIVFSCSSDKIRRKALQEDPSLENLISSARALELSSKQASVIENTISEVNRISRPGKYSNRNRTDKDKSVSDDIKKKCFSCGESWPHKRGKKDCPGFGHTCERCDKPNHLETCCRSQNKSDSTLKFVDVDSHDSSSDSDYVYGIREPPPSINSSSDSDYVFGIKESKSTLTKSSIIIKAEHSSNINKKFQNGKAVITFKVNRVPLKFHVDSGSSVNLINEKTFNQLQLKNLQLRKTLKKLYAYGSNSSLPLLGCFDAEIETENKIISAKKIVVKGNDRMDNLLGLSSSMALGVLKIINSVTSDDEWCSSVDKIVRDNDKVFHGIGKLKDVKVKLHIDESVKPVAQKHRRVPFHLRSKVDKELARLFEAGVIEHVQEATDWVSPVVIVPKRDSEDIRLCVDMTQPNKAIKRIRHVIPTLDELRCDLNGAKYFSKMDLSKGYHQLELAEESRSITTFSTHAGLARFCRLNFGTSSATEIFHEEIRKLLQGVKGAVNIHDDILVTGRTPEEHNIALKQTFKKLSDSGLTLNKNKCIFNKTEIKFFGLVFNADGVSPDPEKVAALKTCEAPTNKKELRSFLGMTNYSSIFIQNYSTITAPLRELLLDKTKWRWDSEHQTTFEILKEKLKETCLLNYFDPNLETEVVCDASPVGVGSILVQTDALTNHKRVIAYGSRSLTRTEKRYGQIEREAVAVLFGCLKFRLYLLGKHFDLYSDHQPLRSMFNNPRSLAPFRVERIRLKLQGYNFTVKHVDGSKNPTDYMSRHALAATKTDIKQSKELEAHVNLVFTGMNHFAVTRNDIAKAILTDDEARILKISIQNNTLDLKSHPFLSKFKKVFKELSVIDDLILKDARLFIPKSLRQQVLTASHDGHQGIVKTKQLLRSAVWYPGMGKEVEALVKDCIPCLASVAANSREPLRMSELPDGPWDKVSADFHGPLPSGHLLLVVIDQYSRYPVVEIVKSTSASASIPVFDKIFGMFGIPLELKSDNGSPFNSIEFERYSKYLGFAHSPITPVYPQANGLIERFNQMIEKVLATAKVEGKSWKRELYTFLRSYRATTHLTTGKSPAELMFQSRPFRTRLPQFCTKKDDAEVRLRDEANKMKMKLYADSKPYVRICDIKVGDLVIVKKPRKTKATPYYDPVPYIVVARKGNMITARRKGHVITRNSMFFKKVTKPEAVPVNSGDVDVELDVPDDAELHNDDPAEIEGDINIQSDVDSGDNTSSNSDEDVLSDGNAANDDESADSEPQPPVNEAAARRSTRTRNPPKRFADYVVDMNGSDSDSDSDVYEGPPDRDRFVPVALNDSYVEMGDI